MDLRLRPVRRDDLDLLSRRDEDPEAAGHFNFMGFHASESSLQRFEEDGFLGQDKGMLIVEVDDTEIAGTVGWHPVRYGGNEGSVAWNVGIALFPEHRRRGIGPAAIGALAEYLFGYTTVNRLEASTDVENVPAQRTLEAAGFQREGIARGAQFRDGAYHDLVVYSRLRADR